MYCKIIATALLLGVLLHEVNCIDVKDVRAAEGRYLIENEDGSHTSVSEYVDRDAQGRVLNKKLLLHDPRRGWRVLQKDPKKSVQTDNVESNGAKDWSQRVRRFDAKSKQTVVLRPEGAEAPISVKVPFSVPQVTCPANIGPNTVCSLFFWLPECYCIVFNKLSWQDAQNNCAAKSMDLVSMDTKLEESSIYYQVKSIGYKRTPFWTSGLYNATTATWSWSNEDKAITGNTNWCTLEPQNPSPNSAIVSSSGCWYDATVDNAFYSICISRSQLNRHVWSNYQLQGDIPDTVLEARFFN